MSTTLVNPKLNNVINNKFEDQDQINNLVQDFCIFGKCNNRFCMKDFLKINLKNLKINGQILLENLMCKNCYEQYHDQYQLFRSKTIGLRHDFFDQWLAIKIYKALNRLEREINNNGCSCGKCNIRNLRESGLTDKECRSIYMEFSKLMLAFGFRHIMDYCCYDECFYD